LLEVSSPGKLKQKNPGKAKQKSLGRVKQKSPGKVKVKVTTRKKFPCIVLVVEIVVAVCAKGKRAPGVSATRCK
jgi:hypothetical protein